MSGIYAYSLCWDLSLLGTLAEAETAE